MLKKVTALRYYVSEKRVMPNGQMTPNIIVDKNMINLTKAASLISDLLKCDPCEFRDILFLELLSKTQPSKLYLKIALSFSRKKSE